LICQVRERVKVPGAGGGPGGGAEVWAGAPEKAFDGTGGGDGGANEPGLGPEAAATDDGKAGTVNAPAQSGHFIACPAYCSGTWSCFWQLGQRRFMRADLALGG
jgi:hypothetical protein